MKEPLISIAVCTYNGERFLAQQLESLLQQDYKNMEIIISDDASTDATRDILIRYEADTRFKIFMQEKNLGPVNNFDFVLKHCRGEFIAFCDQDDIWLPNKISAMLSFMGDKNLVYSDSELVNDYGMPLHKKLSDLRHMYSGTDSRGFVFSNVAWGHAIMIRKDFLQQCLPIPQKIPHDIWFAFKATEAEGIFYLDKPLTLYRQHDSTVTTTITVKATTRKKEKKFADFQEKLNWIHVMENHSSRNSSFYERLYELYSKKAEGRYNWPLFFFLLKYREPLFRFMRKKTSSQIIEIMKQARGEQA